MAKGPRVNEYNLYLRVMSGFIYEFGEIEGYIGGI